MWGTIARMRLRPDIPEEYLRRQLEALKFGRMPGWVRSEFFRSAQDPGELWLVAMWDDEESYRANADSESQHAVYMTIRACLESDPEWHDVDEYVSKRPPGSP
jgi:heme-degrading monooxygenase HmoA